MRANPMLRLLPGKLIGEFVTDVQTVYDYKGKLKYCLRIFIMMVYDENASKKWTQTNRRLPLVQKVVWT